MPFLGSFLSEEQFQCSICLDIFDNPVSTPCGHSFCMTCIGCYWQGAKVCQCPLCKENFKKKPELHINRTLREITEQFKQMKGDAGACGGLEWKGVQGKRIEERPLKQRQLSGDLFLVMKRKLLKPFPSKVSQNDSHTMVIEGTDFIQPQELTRGVSLRRYTLSGAASAMIVHRCPKHHRKLDLFCKSDGECICSECGDSDHQSHQIISAEKEWLNNKTQLDITETKIQEMIEQRLRKVEEIKFLLAEIKMATEREKQNFIRLIGALLSSIEHSQAELLEVIEMRRRSVEHQAESMLRELDLEVTELRKRSAALAKLAQTDCCISGLRSYSDINTQLPDIDKDWTGVSVNCNFEIKSLYNSVCQLLEHSHKELQKLPEIYLSPLTDQSQLKANPNVKTIQAYAEDVILDPSTAHPRLLLSEDRKEVCCGEKQQHVPNNPERFNRVMGVLGQQGFTGGQHYWEVEVSGKTDWDLGIARHSVNRKGKIIFSPSNGFWLLCLRDSRNYTFRKEPSVTLPLHLKPQKIGIFLDYDKGQVSFYNVEAKMLIYTFTDTFSEAIYPFFIPCTNKTGKNYVPLTITPVLLPD